MPFPAVALVDSYARPNESPLSNGGKYTLLAGSVTTGRVLEESFNAITAFSEGEDNAYWNVATYNQPAIGAEVHLDIGNNKRYFSLWACVTSPGTGERSGYRLRAERTGLNKYVLVTERMTKAAFTVLGEFFNVTLKPGDSFALQVASGVLTVWKKTGVGAWTFLYEVPDATYSTGYVGIGMKGNIGQLRNLEVGATHEHIFKVSQSSSPSARRAPARALSPSQAQAASAVRAPARALAATQAQASALRRDSARSLSATAAGAIALTRTPAVQLAVAQPTAKLLARTVARTLTRGQGQAVQLVDEVHEPTHVVVGISSVAVEPKLLASGVAV